MHSLCKHVVEFNKHSLCYTLEHLYLKQNKNKYYIFKKEGLVSLCSVICMSVLKKTPVLPNINRSDFTKHCLVT